MIFKINNKKTMQQIVDDNESTILEKIALRRYKEYLSKNNDTFSQDANINHFNWAATLEYRHMQNFWSDIAHSKMEELTVEVSDNLLKSWKKEFPEFFKPKFEILISSRKEGNYVVSADGKKYKINISKCD